MWKIRAKHFCTSAKAFFGNLQPEPSEYRTLISSNLSTEWNISDINKRFSQIGEIEKSHLITNRLGISLGKGN